MRGQKSRAGGAAFPGPTATRQCTTQAFLRTMLRGRAMTEWREKIWKESGNRKRRPYRVPSEGETPRIPRMLQGVPRELASRFFQLWSGHAMIAPFLKGKFGWVESDSCWWCSGGRQSREHLSKECRTWKKEIRELWSEVGRISGADEKSATSGRLKGRKGFCYGIERRSVRPGNCSVGRLLADPRFTEAVLGFLSCTGVGKIKKGVVVRGEEVE